MSKTITQETFEQRMFNIYGEKYTVMGKYIKHNIPIDIRCNTCNTIFSRSPNALTSTKKVVCPTCDIKKYTTLIKGINDIWSLRPDVGQLLANPEDGYNYRPYSNKKVMFRCPECGHEFLQLIADVSSKGLVCHRCKVSISYPNRFMTNLLDQTQIDFITEYTIPPHPYRYDFYFELNDKSYVIEMDGAFGHGCVDTPNFPKEEQIKTDKIKDLLAEQKEIQMIRIDCQYTDMNNRFEYIKKEIQNSVLQDLFNFTTDNYSQANEKATILLLSQISHKWNEGVRSYDQLEQIFHIKRPAIRRYLKLACDLNLIDSDYQDLLSEIRWASNKKIARSKGIQVVCNETGEVFYSLSEAECKMGISLRSYFSQKRKFAGKLPDGTPLTWRKIIT